MTTGLRSFDGRGLAKATIIRRFSMDTHMVRIYTGSLSQEFDFVSVEADKVTTAEEVIRVAVTKLDLPIVKDYELAEVYNTAGQLCKERRLDNTENPVRVQLLWPRCTNPDLEQPNSLHTGYRFYIRKKISENTNKMVGWFEQPADTLLTDFLTKSLHKEYSDLCNLPDLNERTLLENIKQRFQQQDTGIYTYVGSILIAVNPFQFFPIYNPKYVKMYQNKRLGDLPPHIFAIADAAFHTMLRTKRNQCIVISGESGSGKTESTNLLLHHLTALSHKGLHGSGVEQTILGAGPVLEAFGNAKTVHNNNSSRFGKFIQVNYKENGMVHGAIVEKYLLEKSRIVSQARNERNYHVFYYLLAGADPLEREKLHLGKPEDYHYLNQSDCYNIDDVDEAGEFSRLKQSMEMVGFSQVTQKRIFGVLSAVLHLGNVKFKKKGDQHHDESVTVLNQDTIAIISNLLKVKEKTLVEALTQKRATAGDETVVMTHRMEDALATRDAMAKCLYGALFDWIVLKVNQALLAKRHNSEHQGNSIGVLDIFGFEDFSKNSFEQFCINYANEHLQYYFNQHIFKFEQEEYKKEGIQWKNIEFIDNTGCLELFSRKSKGLFPLLDEECNFPGATNETLLSKFHHHHSKGNVYYEAPQKRELVFTVVHYAGKVKYQIKDFREKNSDQIRTDIVANMKSSSLAFVRELMGVDPVAVLRWTIVKTLIKSMFAFIQAGKRYRARGGPDPAVVQRRKQSTDRYLTIPDLNGSHIPSNGRTSPSDLQRRSPSMIEMRERKLADLTSMDLEEDEVFPRSPRLSGQLRSPVDAYLSEDDARVMIEASRVLMKNKSFKPRSRPQTMFSDIKTLKAIATRTMYTGGKVGSKQKSPSVGAQFQWSLSRLMSTLNQANPFFIRCIKSNAEKEPCKFDDVLVLRQLRYTGMLATVRIRQSGYNYRLTFEEFAQLYKILLPKGLQSDKEDIQEFLDSTPMNNDNYQIGITKVFLRETEKLYLDECLHRAIMKRVIAIQRWVKTKVERKNFVVLRENAVLIQRYVRSFLARRRLMLVKASVLMIQRWYRMMKVQREFQNVRCNTICIQAHIRGHLTRKKYKQQKMEYERLQAEREALKHSDDMLSSASDEGVLLKDSADELENLKFIRRDSEESSGIPDDSESDTLSDAKSRGDSMTTPPPTPTSIGMPGIVVEGLGAATKDPFILQSGKLASRVPDLAKRFQTSPESPMDETDSRTVQGSIFIPRGAGRKRPPKMSPAPLAKQESFSDLESPTAEKGHQLTPERLKDMEDKLKLSRTLMPTDNLTASTEDMYSRSPLKRAVNYLSQQEALRETKSYPSSGDYASLKRRLSMSTSTLIRRTKSSIKILREMKTTSGGRKKKDSAADDSDDEMETGKDHHAKRPKDIGVRVFPAGPLSPKSPKEETSSLMSFDEQDEKGKRIKKKRQTVRATDKDKENKPMETYFSVSKASQWQYPEEFIITDVHELQLLDEFIGRKINDLNKDKQKKEIDKDAGTDKKMPGFDVVLTMCLEAFQMELKTTLSVALQKGTCNTKYRDLFANFEVTMKATCVSQKLNSDFPVTMCINAFRGFLDEFRNLVKKKDNKTKKRKVKHREKAKKDIIEHLGHKFSQVQFGIPTFCELCSNIIWLMEKGHVCQVCRYTCHRKCYSKSTTPCKGVQDPSEQLRVFSAPHPIPAISSGFSVTEVILQFNVMAQRLSGTKVFGVPLNNLVGKEDKMPEFMENLIGLIETHGLFTVGIYRICGNAHKIKTLKMYLDSGHKDININEYAIHVLTATLKSFLRELPEPLLTFELYDEFMQASEIQDEKEAIQVLFSITERLPKLNHDVFERIIFHLARVANHEASNKMSANGLAIIFAPCLLRTNKVIKVQDMISHVNKQQICIEKILQEQLKKLRTTLEDISTLESAEVTANERLTVVRASMRTNREQGKASKQDIPPSVSEDPEALEEQERVISSHIKSLRKEKDELTSGLPSFEYRHSSDDEMLSVDDMESQYETADEDGREESGSSFDIPAEVPSQLRHLTKHRVNNPQRRLPSRHSVADPSECNTPQSSSHDTQKRDTYLSDIAIATHSIQVETKEQKTFKNAKKDKNKRKWEHKEAEFLKGLKLFVPSKTSKAESTQNNSSSHKPVELTKPHLLHSAAVKSDIKDTKTPFKDTKTLSAFSKKRSKLTRSQPVSSETLIKLEHDRGLVLPQIVEPGSSDGPTLTRQHSEGSLHHRVSDHPSTTLVSAIVGSPPRYTSKVPLVPRALEISRISSYESTSLTVLDSTDDDDDDEIMV